MAINQETISDASRAIAFADDVRAVYNQTKEMVAKINRYVDGVAAIAAETADARETKFVQLVQAIVDPADLARIGALLPLLVPLVAELEANYSDFINPT